MTPQQHSAHLVYTGFDLFNVMLSVLMLNVEASQTDTGTIKITTGTNTLDYFAAALIKIAKTFMVV